MRTLKILRIPNIWKPSGDSILKGLSEIFLIKSKLDAKSTNTNTRYITTV